ncbi:MAG: ATP12 family protein [Pseudomonadota bacterium]
MTKKFYSVASSKKVDDGYAIQLDGKTVKTSGGLELIASTETLADAVALEWAKQEDTINPETMPLTQILTTMIDKIRDRDAITDKAMRYLDTDLVCYWAKEPEALAKRQKEIWGRWVKWFDEHFEVPLYTTKKIEAIKQDPEAHKRAWNYIEALDDSYFTVLHIMTSNSGSLILALAFVEGDISPEEIFQASYLEELYRGEIIDEDTHGLSPEEEKEREAFKRDASAAREFIELSNSL